MGTYLALRRLGIWVDVNWQFAAAPEAQRVEIPAAQLWRSVC
jgi:hypothetical protein